MALLLTLRSSLSLFSARKQATNLNQSWRVVATRRNAAVEETTTAGPREPVELAIGVAGHEGWLNALRAWACLRPRPAGAGEPPSVKAAAKKSLQMGKEAAEHTAESAARATDEALERTTETVRRKVSSPRRRDGDL
jgi:hypothetical protein